MSKGIGNIFLSSGAIATREIVRLIERCLEAEMYRVELASGLPCDMNGFEYLGAAAKTHGISFLIHNYFPAPRKAFVLNLAALDSDGLALSKAHCRKAIELCQRFGAPFFSVHSGFALSVETGDLGNPTAWQARVENERIDLVAAREVFAATVWELADYASERGVRLLLENNVVSPRLIFDSIEHHGLLLCEGREIVEFFNNLNHPNVGLLVDVGHAKVSGTALGFTPQEFMDTVVDYVEAFHLSDNDGEADSNQVFETNAWFGPYLHLFPKAVYVIEVYNLSCEQIRRQYKILEDMLTV